MKRTEIIKNLKLPFQFDERRLLNDLNIILNSNWIAHFNDQDYEGKWNSLALYAPQGDENNIFALSSTDNKSIKETALIKNCRCFKEILNQFQCPLLSVRLLKLGTGTKIKPHEDYNLGYENDYFRIHIPITTNPHLLREEHIDQLSSDNNSDLNIL